MKSRIAWTFVAVLILTCSFAFAAAKANFTGTWVLDNSRSEGLPPNVEQTIIMVQVDDKLTFENKITGPNGDITISDSFTINGKEVEFTQKRNDQDLKGKRVSKWLADGSGFESNEELTVENGDGLPVTQKITRKWIMSADGKTFTVDLTATLPDGTQHTKRTFVKK